MLKTLLILGMVGILTGNMSGQPNKAAQQKQTVGSNPGPSLASSNPKDTNRNSKQNQPQPGSNSPRWYTPLERPEWWLVIFAALTGAVILYQSVETGNAARGALKAAEAALLNAQAFINAERPWILVKAEPSKRFKGGFEIIAVNKGRTPATIISHAENLILVEPIEFPPDAAEYGKPDVRFLIILPDESVPIGEITHRSIKDVAERTRFKNMELEGYIFGAITYRDLLGPSTAVAHETRWCFHMLPWQEEELLVMEFRWGGDEYTRHT